MGVASCGGKPCRPGDRVCHSIQGDMNNESRNPAPCSIIAPPKLPCSALLWHPPHKSQFRAPLSARAQSSALSLLTSADPMLREPFRTIPNPRKIFGRGEIGERISSRMLRFELQNYFEHDLVSKTGLATKFHVDLQNTQHTHLDDTHGPADWTTTVF